MPAPCVPLGTAGGWTGGLSTPTAPRPEPPSRGSRRGSVPFPDGVRERSRHPASAHKAWMSLFGAFLRIKVTEGRASHVDCSGLSTWKQKPLNPRATLRLRQSCGVGGGGSAA